MVLVLLLSPQLPTSDRGAEWRGNALTHRSVTEIYCLMLHRFIFSGTGS
jgi:hypothetical protein